MPEVRLGARNDARMVVAYFRIRNWRLRNGTYFDDGEDRHVARVAVLRATVARDLFADERLTPVH